MLPPEIVDKLAKVCGLLSSDKDGERSAAAWKATELLRQHRLSWRELVEFAGRPDEAPIEIEAGGPWRMKAEVCVARGWRLTDWEKSFAVSISGRAYPPTEKQLTVLDRLYRKATAP